MARTIGPWLCSSVLQMLRTRSYTVDEYRASSPATQIHQGM